MINMGWLPKLILILMGLHGVLLFYNMHAILHFHDVFIFCVVKQIRHTHTEAIMGDDSEWMKLPIDQKCEHKVICLEQNVHVHLCCLNS